MTLWPIFVVVLARGKGSGLFFLIENKRKFLKSTCQVSKNKNLFKKLKNSEKNENKKPNHDQDQDQNQS